MILILLKGIRNVIITVTVVAIPVIIMIIDNYGGQAAEQQGNLCAALCAQSSVSPVLVRKKRKSCGDSFAKLPRLVTAYM